MTLKPGSSSKDRSSLVAEVEKGPNLTPTLSQANSCAIGRCKTQKPVQREIFCKNPIIPKLPNDSAIYCLAASVVTQARGILRAKTLKVHLERARI